MAQHVITKEAVLQGAMPGIELWEENPGVIAMRRVLRETAPNTSGRMHGAQQAFPPIKALWQQMSRGVRGMVIPRDKKQLMDTIFRRINTDKQYAIKVYNTFPIIADRYGVGQQANGKPRLSFLYMAQDPICRALL